jgi:hypothetical protein
MKPSTILRVRRFLLLPALMLLCGGQAALAGDARLTRNVMLVTLDGVRIQEVFSGLDETIAAHDEQQMYSEMAQERQRFGGASPIVRREALLPVFWRLPAAVMPS